MNEPLTLEQLREMDGNPVWVESKNNPALSGWGIMLENTCSAYHDIFLIEEYNKTWIAYAYPPSHIDRDVWEPCEWCKDGKITIHIPEFKAMALCNEHMNHEAFDFTIKSSFCPWCGRPLTEEAWEELEKRARGGSSGL